MAPEERAPRPRGIGFACTFATAWGALACALFLASGPVACSGTEVPDHDEAFLGQVQGVDGEPAVSARVIAWGGPDARQAAEEDHEKVSLDTQYTDEHGHFAFGKELASGTYDLYFDDPATPEKDRPVQHLAKAANGLGQLTLRPVRLAPPTVLIISVQDQGTHEPIDTAECWIDPTPYPHKFTGREGIAGITTFFLPPGNYEVSCYSPWSRRTESIVVPPDTASMQMVIYLTPNGENPDPLLAPTYFAVSYDENSGALDMNWSRVNDSRIFGYGIRRQDIDLGAPPQELTMTTQGDTSFQDVPFARTDSVQAKKLRYSVYSIKRDPGGALGYSRGHDSDLNARRPWAYGPRIDSLAPLDSLGAYHVGDTVRIAAAWTNRISENDSLFWRITGTADPVLTRVHPAASGKDTLAFVLPAKGDYQVSLTIRDAEGHRSWLALPLRF
ncbi:MAG: hypothetical protein JF616_11680 [Fibrobacteres bacterium]|nr:hypothetical protein [Fibrobacterota bacterium]